MPPDRPTHPDRRWSWATSRLLGYPLKPHQVDMIDAIGAPAGPGYAATTAVVLLPRQVGKTTALFTLILARMQYQRDYRAAYTAQTGHVVTERFGEPGGWFDQVNGSPLRARHRMRRSGGTERIQNRLTNSFVKAFPPVPGKLRSSALDLVVLDECQEHSPDVGAALDADAGPTMTTRPRRQLLLAGTAGVGPGWWADKVADARAGKYLLVEMGTWPDDADPADPATWRAHHPGLRTGMTDEAFLAAQLNTLGPDTFAREYGNRWQGSGQVGEPAYPPDLIAAATVDAGPPATARAWLAVEVAVDRSAAAIVAAIPTRDARVHLELITVVPPYAAASTAAQLARRHRARLCGIGYGPTGPVVDELQRTGIPVDKLGWAETTRAAAALADALTAGTVQLLHTPQLLDAMRGARRKQRGDSWSIAGGSISDATATAAAVAHDAARVAGLKPAIRTA